MGFNVASVKSYVSSALTTTLFGSGVGEREVGKLTSIIMNKMLFAQGWQFSVEVDGLEGRLLCQRYYLPRLQHRI